MAEASGKICTICGQDCGDRPRVKDRDGAYRCRACHEATAGAEPFALADPPPRVAAPPIPVTPPVSRPASPPGPVEPERLDPIAWPGAFVIRPAAFHRSIVVGAAGLLVALAATWIDGIAGMIDQMETRFLLEEFGRTSGVGALFGDSWGAYWLIAALLGIVAGAIEILVGGAWYLLRLLFCGADDLRYRRVVRVYACAGLPTAVGIIVASLWDTARYPSPSAAANGDLSWVYLVIVLGVGWSVAHGFVAARSVFGARKGPAIFWFAVLPAGWYLTCIGCVAAGVAWATAIPADTANPQSFSGPSFSLQYPGNWTVETGEGGTLGDSFVTVAAVFQGARVDIMAYESEQTAEEELDASAGLLTMWIDDVSRAGDVTRWGSHEGDGATFTGTVEGLPVEVVIIVVDLGGHYLEVEEFAFVDEMDAVSPGFGLIRRTLQTRISER